MSGNTILFTWLSFCTPCDWFCNNTSQASVSMAALVCFCFHHDSDIPAYFSEAIKTTMIHSIGI